MTGVSLTSIRSQTVPRPLAGQTINVSQTGISINNSASQNVQPTIVSFLPLISAA
jgi:hypothetical protein